MRTIYKFPIPMDRFELDLPMNHEVVHVGEQGNKPMMWVELDAMAERVPTMFQVVGTGWDMGARIDKNELSWHVGTWVQGPWVWHLYEVVKYEEETGR